jgi:hypothetical protein
MSGAEARLVLGLISSTITVIETCKTLYDAAHDASGLPEAFRKVAENIPLVLRDHVSRESIAGTIRRDIRKVERCRREADY